VEAQPRPEEKQDVAKTREAAGWSARIENFWRGLNPSMRWTLVILGAGSLLLLLIPWRYRAAITPEPGQVAVGALKILVKESGLYRIEQGALAAINPTFVSFEAATLHLSQAGQSVPFYLDGNGIVFYGQGSADRYTAERVYLLRAGETVLATGETAVLMPETALPQMAGAPLPQLRQRQRLEENLVYDSRATATGWPEPWFWQTIQVQGQVTIHFDLPALADAPGELHINVWGATSDDRVEFDHDFDVIVNSRSLATVQWQGSVYHTAVVPLPAGALQTGANTLVLDNTPAGGTLVDIMRLDWIELVYKTLPQAREDRFLVENSAGQIALSGFSGRPILFDISNPERPHTLSGADFTDTAVQFTVKPAMRVMAVGPQGFLTPYAIKAVRESSWRDRANQADFLIITTDELAPALAPLAATREAQGLKTVIIPIAELYDDFGYGEASPTAVTEFLRYALNDWSEPYPRYLLLVGEATYDYRGYVNKMPANHVPTLLVPVTYGGETVSDSRMVDVDGDMRPDLAVGRWPVNDAKAVARLVARGWRYEQGTAVAQALVVADGSSPEFSNFSDNMISGSRLPEEQAQRLYGASAADLVAIWNQGTWLVTYTGHGSLDRWGKDDVFTTAAVAGLHSGTTPAIVLQFTCLTGFFAHPSAVSLAEVMLAHDNGPVLTVAATSLTLSSSQAPFAVNLVRALQDPAVQRIGDALQQAKASLNIETISLREINDTFGLLGDPSTPIIRP
jgi:hypothetical protein